MKIIYTCFTVLILSFLTVYSITPFIIRFARKINFLDNPNARKVHKKSTPLMGGLAVFIGFTLITIYVIITNLHAISGAILGYLGGALIIVTVGLLDDRFGMNPLLKLVGQAVSCLVFLYFNDLLHLFGAVYITLPLLFLWMVGLMNALNFLDNMDGIITGMSGILAFGFYALSFISHSPAVAVQANFMALLSLIFAGSVFGFLPHNFNPAKIFLGDAGSMFIGYFLSTMGILAGRLVVIRMNHRIYYLLPVLLLSYAIFDISLVSFTRKRDGRRISQGGKDHSTHRIDNAMRSAKVTAIIVYLINIIIVLVTVLVLKMESIKLLVLSTIMFAIIFLFFGNKLDNIPVVIPENQLIKPNNKDT
ncbi:MAG: undecaprenyl/decaprenyl-phosphate alpha-N-acetylglucosaminyl 1-phosphate transferase [Candidatus Cloacimonetes bacterium]|nr:undecaprenyl/decaprenyl-phosphate alpha-N-acetylglucosaminyl 1-phosphate transferase [Candidatus Cloacimonadota bacterium]MCF7814289.1 undecaprenyl/decaprenyl-phosphate alpha-N-acetylglucosaminyl 1-phosphate transferase [Candidatus Cloacimonadota bacterium]MCF7868882.1 undecaprenyl/decaprenyl-phosphate alpha-N-acetylglucosaminyl 1-phosphate transferase [Candidatus Cloacimonadota bacterium]MCF7884330.1 undecaprenyl/decaprenyl-phosphate alpha-N-acetylglucosaminyl 1-phosphate transferase [Candid